MKKINRGKVINGEYVKHVSFSRAVLWMTKELSLRPVIIKTLALNEIKKLVFIDDKKKEKWTFKLEDILREGGEKTVGQEEQFYFPIHLAVKSKVEVSAIYVPVIKLKKEI